MLMCENVIPRKIVTLQKKGGCYSSINETLEHVKTTVRESIGREYCTRENTAGRETSLEEYHEKPPKT